MEQITFEQAINLVRGLPPRDRRRVREWIDAQEHQPPQAMPLTLQEREARFRRALQWIDENKANYLGQWVALDGDRLLATGTDGKQVYAEAVAAGVAVPLLQQLNADDDLPFGGW